MRSKIVTNFFLITALFIFLSPARAEVPGQVNYQGYLTDAEGYPIDGIVDMEFAIYSQEFEGSPIWFEEHYGVTVTAGVYHVILGETSTVTYDLFLSSCWLEVAVGEEGAAELEILEPRQPIVSSFFAIYAHNADYLDGMDSSDFAEEEHGHPIDEITGSIDADTVDGYEGAALEESQEIIDAIDAHELLPSIHHTKTTSFTELTGEVTDAQVPDSITINYALTAGDADTVDGYEGHASYTDEMAISAGQNEFVNEIGDTITGDLNILGNVSIGTTESLGILSVKTDSGIDGISITRNGNDGYVGIAGNNGGDPQVRFNYGSDHFAMGIQSSEGSFLIHNGSTLDDTSGTTRIAITSEGKVGIGTDDPSDLLHIRGSNAQLSIQDNSAGGQAQVAFNSNGEHAYIKVDGSSGDLAFTNYSQNPNMVIDVGGSVGIRTTEPSTLLEIGDDYGVTGKGQVFVNGQNSYNDGYYIDRTLPDEYAGFNMWNGWATILARGDTSTHGRLRFRSTDDGSSFVDRFVIIENGDVGIGTTEPDYKLHVDTGTTGYIGIEYDTNQYGGIAFHENGIPSGYIQLNDNPSTDRLEFLVGGGAGVDKKMVIQDDGNVGIGTTDPQTLLHVAGDARIDGNIAAKYQDIAEWVESPQKLEPGTVVVIDKKCSNRVVPSNAAYDTGVAGVVSKEPGLLLGVAGNGKYKISHSGRVRTKVDASFCAIEPGDLLVASPIPGVAMKSEPVNITGVEIHRPGTILGKALESLDEGEGEILVLLSLQ